MQAFGSETAPTAATGATAASKYQYTRSVSKLTWPDVQRRFHVETEDTYLS